MRAPQFSLPLLLLLASTLLASAETPTQPPSAKEAEVQSQALLAGAPLIGAQVFIEPGQSAEEIDRWFALMAKNDLKICRIRMFETYMRTPTGAWDFTLFDHAFRSAEKHKVGIFGTLFPSTPFMDVGGFKFPRDQAHQALVAAYIKNLTSHFRQFTSLAGWVLINEPGSGKAPDTAWVREQRAAYKARNPAPEFGTNGYPIVDFSEDKFLLELNTWYLNWLAEQVKLSDPGRHLHVNNHGIYSNVAEYDFPAWRKFLSSFGGSAHASWHFGYFTRERYTLAMSANSELIRSGAGQVPWLMTELQGGNNTYSGYAALCPTKEEIAQWLWTNLASGSKGAIFWCLNPRASGIEAGEWALLDFQDSPSDRFMAAASVAHTLEEHSELFAKALPTQSGIHILYTRESLWAEKKSKAAGTSYEGRDVGGVMKSSLGYFEALSELGVPCQFGALDEFDFAREDFSGVSIILAQQIALPSTYWPKLERFVSLGGKLLVDGLTGYFDENMHCVMKTGFPLAKLFGGTIREFKLVAPHFELSFAEPDLTLPAHLWRGTIFLATARAVSTRGAEVYASRNRFGKGEVLWLPSLAGLGARQSKLAPLAKLLAHENAAILEKLPARFAQHQPGLWMRTLKSGERTLAIVINKSGATTELDLVRPTTSPISLVAGGEGGSLLGANRLWIASEATVVLVW